jgi:hypothetical protein
VLARLRLAELDGLAERHPGALRPRWENNPGLWHALLCAAQRQDARHIAEASLQGIQLMAASCVPQMEAAVRRGPLARRVGQPRIARAAARRMQAASERR